MHGGVFVAKECMTGDGRSQTGGQVPRHHVILSDDIFTIDPTTIEIATVDLTMVGGAVVYERGDGKSVAA